MPAVSGINRNLRIVGGVDRPCLGLDAAEAGAHDVGAAAEEDGLLDIAVVSVPVLETGVYGFPDDAVL